MLLFLNGIWVLVLKERVLSYADPSNATSALTEINENTFLDSLRLSMGGQSRCTFVVLFLSFQCYAQTHLYLKEVRGKQKIRRMKTKGACFLKVSYQWYIQSVFTFVRWLRSEKIWVLESEGDMFAYLGYLLLVRKIIKLNLQWHRPSL